MLQKNNATISIYNEICNAKKNQRKLLAILIDPDKISLDKLEVLVEKIKLSPATHLFVGGSDGSVADLDEIVIRLKQSGLPVIMFPGHPSQISFESDGILYLSLLSGRNPDYLIQHQVDSATILKKSSLEIIPTAYLLIDGGKISSVERVSQTKPISIEAFDQILSTAIAGELLGMKLLYLESGSGALNRLPDRIIHKISDEISIPLIVGGGFKNYQEVNKAFQAGADMVVIGTAFENDLNFFDHFQKLN